MEGDSNGNLSLHVRACGEFSRRIMSIDDVGGDEGLISLSLEIYAYLALVAQLEGPVSGGDCWSSSSDGHLASILDHLQGCRTFGNMFGCAHALYKMIPDVAKHIWCPKRHTADCPYHSSYEAYHALKSRIKSWRNEDEEASSPASSNSNSSLNSSFSAAEYAYGMTIQNALLMLLHYAHIRDDDDLERAMKEKIQPLVDGNLMLLQLVSEAPVVNVSLWPLVVLGSMLRKDEQKQIFVARLRNHSGQVRATSRMVELLSLVWKHTATAGYGLQAVAGVASEQGSRFCFT